MKETKLVIVESPAKCKKIEKFLSKKKEYNWIVKASYGHITELKESLEDSIDIQNNFKPTYIISSGKKKVVQELSQIIKKDNVEVIIATDPDREGEAIGYHLIKTLKLDIKNTKRIFFNQITEKAVLEAVENPKVIDMNLVNAQQSRCILDKLVGFEISPILWKYIKYGLSAGRCQTPSIRLLTEKEKEINKFNKQSYYKITGDFIINDNDNIKGEIDLQFENKEIITKLLTIFMNDTFYIQDTKKTKSLKNPSAPFTTSTLQQEASIKLNISPKECMSIAQKLYENGHITYMRTDSIELSSEFKNETNQYILKNYGDNYIYNQDKSINRFKNKSKNTQEAHEAIRPVKVDTNTLSNTFNAREKNIYKLIWNRTVASLMTSQNLYVYKIFIHTEKTKEIFISQYEETIFDGFSRLYQNIEKEENKQKENIIKSIKKDQELSFKTIHAEQKYTKPIPRYTEASLIKELEKLGIGRPSTYSSIITKIQDKHYVEKKSKEGEEIISESLCIQANKDKIIKKDNKIRYGTEKDKLYITPVGMMVNDFIEKYFINNQHHNGIFDYQMTSDMENKLDDIANGKLKWIQVIKDIYQLFHPTVEQLKNNNSIETKKMKYQKILGKNTEGFEIGIMLGKNEYVIYQKNPDFKTKLKFANMKELNKDVEDVTLEDALYLLRFPKDLGQIDDIQVVLNKGQYGLYLTHNKKNYPIQNENITFENAKNIIEGNVDTELTQDENNNIVGKYNEIPILFKKGKFGYYLSHDNNNYPIDKKIKSIDNIDLDKAIQFIKQKENTFIKVIDKDISIRQNKKGNGYYIMYKKDMKTKPLFITIPKNDNIDEYDKEKCMKLILT